jgi:hypothetical protein
MKRALMLLAFSALAGCRNDRPRWEATLSVEVITHPTPETKAVARLEMRRPQEEH